jgi:hypothetical protein
MASLKTIDDEAGIAERELYRAMITRYLPRLREVLADDLVYMHSNGVTESKVDYLEGVAGGLYEYEAIETRYAQHWSHGNAVVRTGLISMVVGERNKPKSETALLFTTLWRREGRWRLVLRQTTRASGP